MGRICFSKYHSSWDFSYMFVSAYYYRTKKAKYSPVNWFERHAWLLLLQPRYHVSRSHRSCLTLILPPLSKTRIFSLAWIIDNAHSVFSVRNWYDGQVNYKPHLQICQWSDISDFHTWKLERPAFMHIYRHNCRLSTFCGAVRGCSMQCRVKGLYRRVQQLSDSFCCKTAYYDVC